MSDDEKYDVLEKIGQGSFGIIRKVRRRSDGYVLCRKEISYSKMSQKEREQLQAELSILKELRHPNIVQYIDRVHLKTSHDLHVYMEYCGNGDLGAVIKRLKSKRQVADEEFVWSIFSQLCAALYRCHYGQDPPDAGRNVLGLGNNAIPIKEKQRHITILHRDLKPENVFLGEDNSVKLGDFGLSKIMQSHDFASTYVGTPYYMSPEICMSEKYTAASDIWALGCIIYELCAQKPPFDAKTHFDLIQRIRRGIFDPIPDCYSPDLKNVIATCLKTDYTKRPETAQLLNLPVVKLMRKEQEVVQMGQLLKKERDATRLLEKELGEKIATLEKEKDDMRLSVDNQLRREWELKARLEIDRHINTELDRLRKNFEEEVNKRVEEEVERRMHVWKLQQNAVAIPSSTPALEAAQSISTLGEPSEFPSQTDISSLCLEESPPRPLKPRAATPEKRPARSAFQRAHTTAFNEVAASPMDIQMADPSPVSLAGLSLSPRRNALNAEPKTRRNIFAAAERKNLSDPASPIRCTSPTADVEEMEDDDLPALPSPTRPRSINGARKSPDNDPFKVLAANNAPNPATQLFSRRNLLARNGPAPNRGPSVPNLRAGGAATNRPRPNSTVPVVATSPARKRTKVPSAGEVSPIRKNSTGSMDVSDAGFARDTASTALRSKKGANTAALLRQKTAAANNANITSNLSGRTLVELAQGKASTDRRSSSSSTLTIGELSENIPVRKNSSALLAAAAPQWDPESADAPSPFIKRNTGFRLAVGGLR
ncbi:G2-specific protein kinase nim-1 [Lasiodiplodia hormozganensis]|uniref:non-specific serine/threonine protein kinase n=1 Tax=Lasiodiplodia hormozganensis TaxID=869390 RepID=A0AA39XU26_9PEZI|nr:G2-specific protein kinase nim-1 [Lasiodiplodia hormozganensis]